MRGHIQPAEVETGANQRPLRLRRLQTVAEKASASHDALDLAKDWLHHLATQFVDSLPRLGPQLARHALLGGDAVRGPATGEPSAWRACAAFDRLAVAMNNSRPFCSSSVTSSWLCQ